MSKYLTAVLILFSISAQSQISIYSTAGINISSTNFDLEDNIQLLAAFESTTNPFITIGLTVPMKSNLNLFGELSYSTFGYKYVTGISSFQTTVHYTQINFQPGVSYQINPVKLELGGYVGNNLTYKYEIDASTWSEGTENDIKINGGLFAGAKFKVYQNFDVLARYYYGLSAASKSIYTDANGNPIYELKEKINYIQLGLSYTFI